MSQSNQGKGAGGNSNKNGNTGVGGANRPTGTGNKSPANRGDTAHSKAVTRGAPGSRPVQQSSGARNTAARPPTKRGQPVPPPSTSFRAQMDRSLPPFSARRYIAIWAAFMALAIVVILLLWRPWSNNGTAGVDKYMVINTVKGCIVAKLYTDPAANVSKTVANFEQKANANYFNGLTFHRVESWVIQGGDPQGTGNGGGSMPSEYNKLTFKAGSLGVARAGNPAINNDSQFFITKTAYPSLDGQYTNFGEVMTGMDVVNKIAIGDKITQVSVVTRPATGTAQTALPTCQSQPLTPSP